MSTSNSIGQTIVNTAKVIEHALRRCGVKEVAQTPQIIDVALECLFSLLTSMSSRGLNLWAVDKRIQTLSSGKATYVLPDGTIDVLNVNYSAPTLISGTPTINTYNANGPRISVASPTVVCRVGISITGGFTDSLSITPTFDGSNYYAKDSINIPKQNWDVNGSYAFDLNGAQSIYGVQVQFTSSPGSNVVTAANFYASVYDQPMTPFNRDDYNNQPNKNQTGKPCTNYYFEKLVAPQITFWPVPNNSTDHAVFVRHRYIQDIGSLTQQLELPSRWLDPVEWLLARRMLFELPVGLVDKDRFDVVMKESENYLGEAELNETDHLPVYFTPNIRPYTR